MKQITWLVLAILIIIGILFFKACDRKPAPQVYRIGILNGAAIFSAIIDGFKSKMAELGYTEGKNIVYDIHVVNGDADAEQEVLRKFVTDKVDLIFVFPTGSAVAAKDATRGEDIPVVFAMTFIEGTGIIENIRQPGGNITGIRESGPEEIVKRFELLHELVPEAKRIYLTYDESYPANKSAIKALRPVASSLGITLVESKATSSEDIRADLQLRSASDDIGIDAILMMPDPLSHSSTSWPLLSEFAKKYNLPIGGGASFVAEAGAVFSYVADYIEIGRLAAISAQKILKGTPAGTIPVATPIESFRFNYKRAQELGLTVPESLLSLATEIIR